METVVIGCVAIVAVLPGPAVHGSGCASRCWGPSIALSRTPTPRWHPRRPPGPTAPLSAYPWAAARRSTPRKRPRRLPRPPLCPHSVSNRCSAAAYISSCIAFARFSSKPNWRSANRPAGPPSLAAAAPSPSGRQRLPAVAELPRQPLPLQQPRHLLSASPPTAPHPAAPTSPASAAVPGPATPPAGTSPPRSRTAHPEVPSASFTDPRPGPGRHEHLPHCTFPTALAAWMHSGSYANRHPPSSCASLLCRTIPQSAAASSFVCASVMW